MSSESHGHGSYQEGDQINTGVVLTVGVVSILVFAVGAYFANELLNFQNRVMQPQGAAPTPPEIGQAEVGVVNQWLFSVDTRWYDQLDTEHKKLAAYGWVDKEKGTVHLPVEKVFEQLVAGTFPLNPVAQIGPPAPVPWPGPGYPTVPQLLPAAPGQPGSPATPPGMVPPVAPGGAPGSIDTRSPGSPGSPETPAAVPSIAQDPKAPGPLPAPEGARLPQQLAPKDNQPAAPAGGPAPTRETAPAAPSAPPAAPKSEPAPAAPKSEPAPAAPKSEPAPAPPAAPKEPAPTAPPTP